MSREELHDKASELVKLLEEDEFWIQKESALDEHGEEVWVDTAAFWIRVPGAKRAFLVQIQGPFKIDDSEGWEQLLIRGD